MDGFDHYSDQIHAREKWDTTAFGSYINVAGRFGGAAANGGLFSLTQGQLAAVATRTVGFAVMVAAGTYTSGYLICFWDGATEQLSVRWTTGGAFLISRNGTTLATSTQTLLANKWYYIEFQATINASTGSYTLKVIDGGVETTWLTATGVNTQSTGNATTNGMQLAQNNALLTVDDFYCLNSSGSVNNTFLGECRILTSFPTADSATNKAWTPDTGTAHFSRVNDATNPDDDTSYVYSATAGQLDTYSFATVSPTGAVAAVQTSLCARKDDVGSRTISSEYRGGGVNYDGVNQFSPGSQYFIFRQIYETDPATGLVWTASGINAGEFGVKCVA
jgi:hypothetical protein